MTPPPDDVHPDELLAGFVDGALGPAERAEVEAHLESCMGCRRDVDLARRARGALQALPELPVPMGTTRAVVDEARRGVRGARLTRMMWPAAAAAAAAVVGVLLWATLHGVGSPGSSSALGTAPPAASQAAPPAANGAGTTAPASVPLIRETVNYDTWGIQRLVHSLAAGASADHAADGRAAPTVPSAGPSTNKVGVEPNSDFAVNVPGCIQHAAGRSALAQAVPVALFQARFEGRPVFIGAYDLNLRDGPQPDVLAVWVAARSDCSLLHYASAALKPSR